MSEKRVEFEKNSEVHQKNAPITKPVRLYADVRVSTLQVPRRTVGRRVPGVTNRIVLVGGLFVAAIVGAIADCSRVKSSLEGLLGLGIREHCLPCACGMHL